MPDPRDGIRKNQEVEMDLDKMVNRFLSWPVPESVCADLCATQMGYQGRVGTNLLNAAEARQMLQHVLSEKRPQTSDTNLLPCPFCGGAAEIDTQRGYSQYPSGKSGSGVAIYCTECSADMMLCREDMRGQATEDLVSVLTEQWNRRA